MASATSKNRISSVAVIVVTLGLLALGCFLAYRGSAGQTFMPRAYSFLFNRELIRLHGWSDVLIGLSYVSISITLIYLAFRAREELPFHWMAIAFATFIVACGMTHFMEVWTLSSSNPPYWEAGWVKLVTAAASVATAILLPTLVPKILHIFKSASEASARRGELEKAYSELSELYRKATQPVPKKERIASIIDLRVLGSRPEGIAEIAREVTEHARQLERAKHAAEDANRAKDQFLAVLSHELRTPLTPALAAASALEAAKDIDADELRESLSLIRRNIELEARLVDDLLDLTRISKGKLQVHFATVDLHQTIRHAAEMCRSEANSAHSNLTLELRAESHHVRGDGARLAQVFWNLILNAVKFTPAHGRVTVRSENPQPNKIRLQVSDTGIGVEPDKLTRIFEPFQQAEESTTRRFGGLGLGLSVAKGLLDAHGGSISAFSEGKDQGTTFTVELATAAPPPHAVGAPPKQHIHAFRTLRILVVEDHPDTRQTLCRILSHWGHEVESAGTLAEGLSAGTRQRPDVLLSDIGLPDGTGIELLQKLGSGHGMIAIAMSGYGMESDLEKTRNVGFDEHLVKPVAAERLKEAIYRLSSSSSFRP